MFQKCSHFGLFIELIKYFKNSIILGSEQSEGANGFTMMFIDYPI